MPLNRIVILLVLIIICSGAAFSQNRGRGRRTATNPQPPSRSQTNNTDPYWAAQRSIEAAIQQLEAYLRVNPDGERAATARQQLEALRSLSMAASRPEWASMSRRARNSAPDWRVASVDPQQDRTRVTIEVRCPRQDGGDCYLHPFDRSPLVLVDNLGRFYPMINAGSLPQDIRITGWEPEVTEGQAVLSGGRVITVIVDFSPLARGVVSGQVYYRDNNQAEPAKFSLIH